MALAQLLRDEGRFIGRQEGMQQGMQQGEVTMLLRLLESRFGDVSDKIRTHIQNTDTETLLIWSERLLVVVNIFTEL